MHYCFIDSALIDEYWQVPFMNEAQIEGQSIIKNN